MKNTELREKDRTVLSAVVEAYLKAGRPVSSGFLSQKRAESVVKYLVGKGIASGRLTAKGFGPDKAVATNDTPEGRESNRRVEFTIVASDASK